MQQILIHRKLWLAIGWFMVVLVFYLSLMPHPPQIDVKFADKYEHFIAYAGLMGWFSELYTGRKRFYFMIAFIYMGVQIEFLQDLQATRTYDVMDMYTNACGVLAALLLYQLFPLQLLKWFERVIHPTADRVN